MLIVTELGDLYGYGTVWYYAGGIAKIVSLIRVQERFKVTYDSDKGAFFTKRRTDRTTRALHPNENGLHTFQFCESEQLSGKVNAVWENLKSYPTREVKAEKVARRLMKIMGKLIESHIRQIVPRKQLWNCCVTDQDVQNA